MKMRKISAASIAEALATARKELGEDAILLETKKATQGKGVVVTFAVEAAEEPLFNDPVLDQIPEILPFRNEIPKPTVATAPIDHPAISIIADTLDYHGIPNNLREKILTILHRIRLKPDVLIEVAQTALADALTQSISFQPIATATKIPPKRALMFVGPHGAGKTSAIAKFATELTLHKQPITIVSTDMERLAGTEALQKLSSIVKCRFETCDTRAQLKSILANTLGTNWVLIDSSGANIYEFSQMKALGELASLQGVEPILTCPAGMDADEAQEMASVFDFLPIERMVVTRVDAARRLRGVFSAMCTGSYALANFSDAATPADSCQPLTPYALARLMLRHERERIST